MKLSILQNVKTPCSSLIRRTKNNQGVEFSPHMELKYERGSVNRIHDYFKRQQNGGFHQ